MHIQKAKDEVHKCSLAKAVPAPTDVDIVVKPARRVTGKFPSNGVASDFVPEPPENKALVVPVSAGRKSFETSSVTFEELDDSETPKKALGAHQRVSPGKGKGGTNVKDNKKREVVTAIRDVPKKARFTLPAPGAESITKKC